MIKVATHFIKSLIFSLSCKTTKENNAKQYLCNVKCALLPKKHTTLFQKTKKIR